MHHRLPVRANLTTAFYAGPQQPADAQRLFDAAAADLNLLGDIATPLPPGRGISSALLLCKEWGLDDQAHRLATAIEASYEPTWDTDRAEFTWGMGLNEEHPRGQFNAFLAAAEACSLGAWTQLSAAPLPPSPQVVGVDFPTMGFARAEWIDGTLHLRSAPRREVQTERTSFEITDVDPAAAWHVSGGSHIVLEPTSSSLRVSMPVSAMSFTISR